MENLHWQEHLPRSWRPSCQRVIKLLRLSAKYSGSGVFPAPFTKVLAVKTPCIYHSCGNAFEASPLSRTNRSLRCRPGSHVDSTSNHHRPRKPIRLAAWVDVHTSAHQHLVLANHQLVQLTGSHSMFAAHRPWPTSSPTAKFITISYDLHQSALTHRLALSWHHRSF